MTDELEVAEQEATDELCNAVEDSAPDLSGFLGMAKETANGLCAAIDSLAGGDPPIETRLILPHLDRLTFDDLQYVARKIDTYRDAVQSILEQHREERMKELQARMKEMQERIERDRAELAALSPVPVPTAKSKLENPSTPKYRDPAKPENTWAGRGKKPTWLLEKLESGEKLEDFLIDKPMIADPVNEDTGF